MHGGYPFFFVKAFGLFSSELGAFNFTLSSVQYPEDGASVQIALGYATDDSAHGNTTSLGDIWLSDATGQKIAHLDISDQAITQGAPYDFKVDTHDRAPEYLAITATKTSACVSWMALTLPGPGEGSTSVLTGDFFKHCTGDTTDLDYYYGGVAAGHDDEGNEYYPLCGWIDADHSDGHQVGYIKAHMRTFALYYETEAKSVMCRPPVLEFGSDPNTIDKREGTPDITSKRRGNRGDYGLVTSKIPQQSAIELCNAPNSSGPDFASLYEGMYCDMTTRELHPICTENNAENCFNLDVVGRNMSGIIGKRNVQRQFDRVVEWPLK